MRIGVVGATGFIGKVFYEYAMAQGHEIIAFSRKQRVQTRMLEWRVFDKAPDLSGLNAIVNFSGESIAQRWSDEKKQLFYESRVGVTQTIVNQIEKLPEAERPSVFMSSSAVGIYGDCDDEKLTEGSPAGSGYLADLCVDWEKAALDAEKFGVRVVTGRIGIVLGNEGAAWKQMKLAFKLGLGGNLGNGRQWMPWVDVIDVAGGVLHSLTHNISGPVNLVSPDVRRNSEFTKALAKSLGRLALLPAPAFALKIVFGEFGKHLLDSYRVFPETLQNTGYEFKSQTLEEFFQKSP